MADLGKGRNGLGFHPDTTGRFKGLLDAKTKTKNMVLG